MGGSYYVQSLTQHTHRVSHGWVCGICEWTPPIGPFDPRIIDCGFTHHSNGWCVTNQFPDMYSDLDCTWKGVDCHLEDVHEIDRACLGCDYHPAPYDCPDMHEEIYNWRCDNCGWVSERPYVCPYVDDHEFEYNWTCHECGWDSPAEEPDGYGEAPDYFDANDITANREDDSPVPISIVSSSNPNPWAQSHQVVPGCKCEYCKMGRFKKSKLFESVVHYYSDKPEGGWKLYSTGNDRWKYFLGVELETDNYSNKRHASIDNIVAASMARPDDFWMPKTDSSISGPEFCSHPATLAWWHWRRPSLENMFKMLLHAGYRSHDNDSCGMHVNISRAAFDDSHHLYRFMQLIHDYPRWSIRMSQRTGSSVSQWARLDIYGSSGDADGQCVQVMRNAHTPSTNLYGYSHPNFSHGERHVALNAPENEPRFEFRLPRGTLRVDRFYKNLEWATAMIEYSRESGKSMHPQNFMGWCEEQKKTYPNLVAFMAERKDSLLNVLDSA